MSSDEFGDDDEQTVHVADSVDEFVERMRHEQILDARQRASDALRDSTHIKLDATGSRKERAHIARKHVASVVTQFILECEPLFKKTEQGQALWDNTHLDTVPFHECVAIPIEYESIEDYERTRGLDFSKTKGGQRVFNVMGIQDYLSFDETQCRLNCITYSNSHTGTVKTTNIRVSPAPLESTSREAYRATNALLSSLDLGVSMADLDNDVVEDDYSEYLDDL